MSETGPGDGAKATRGTRDLWSLLSAAALAGASATMAAIAFNEPILGPALTVLTAMLSLLFVLVVVTGRPILVSLATASPLLLLTWLNETKFGYLRENVHFIDLYLLAQWARTERSFFTTYWREFGLFLAGLALFLLLIVVVVRFESRARHGLLREGGLRRSAIGVGLVGVAALGAFGSGDYLKAMKALGYYNQLSVNTGVRASYAVMAFSQLQQLRSDIARIEERSAGGAGWAAAAAPGEFCDDCPDIIVFHVESAFDPPLLTQYQSAGSIWSHLPPGADNANGSLRTSVFGGMSMISEFELLCQMHTRTLGFAGGYPNLFVRPFVRNCVPERFRQSGYETYALYSTVAGTNHAGNMFQAYGFDSFIDAERLKLPARWHLIRDRYLIDAAKTILAQERRRPRLIFISGMFNHGPHGAAFITERFPGPYDIDLASNPQTRDYVNRLNDTIGQIAKLEDALRASGTPTAVVYYGDHQPSIDAAYSDAARDRYGAGVNMVTFYRMFRNYPIQGDRRVAPDLHISDLMTQFMLWAGLRQRSQAATAAATTVPARP